MAPAVTSCPRGAADRDRTQLGHRQPAAAGYAGSLPGGIPGQSPRRIGGDGRRPAGDRRGRAGRGRRAAPGSPGQPAGQRPAGVPGGQAGSQLGDDDHPVRRRLPGWREPPAGAAGGGRQLRHLGAPGGPPEPRHQCRAQAGRALENLRRILAIEYLLAAQAFEFLAPQRFGQGTAAAWGILRERVPAYDTDRWLAPDIASAAAILGERKSLARLAASIGDLQ